MSGNVRPESMERITNFELANAFIDEQVRPFGSRLAIRRSCWLCPAAWTLPLLQLC